jgi:hypothetical protein
MTLRKVNAGYAARNRYVEFDFDFTTFAAMAATNGLAFTGNIGAPLPAGAIVDSCAVFVGAYFTGGGASSVALQVGATGILGDLVSTHNLFSTTTLSKWLAPGTPGVQLVGPAWAGLQLLATITPDGAHQLKLLTAGNAKVQIYYSLPDSNTQP